MEAQFFSHKSNFRYNSKTSEMLAHFGYVGYGLYWAIIEQMAIAEDNKLSFKCFEGLAYILSYDTKKLEEFVKMCCKDPINLFSSDDEFYWSEDLNDCLKKVAESHEKKSLAGKIGSSKRWGKKNIKVITENSTVIDTKKSEIIKKKKNKKNNEDSYTESSACTDENDDAITEDNKIKENKKKIKENKINKNKEIKENFFKNKLWPEYPERNGKKLLENRAKQYFLKQFEIGDLNDILQAVRNYAKSEACINGYAKDLINFFKNDFWRNWLVPETPKKIKGVDLENFKEKKYDDDENF